MKRVLLTDDWEVQTLQLSGTLGHPDSPGCGYPWNLFGHPEFGCPGFKTLVTARPRMTWDRILRKTPTASGGGRNGATPVVVWGFGVWVGGGWHRLVSKLFLSFISGLFILSMVTGDFTFVSSYILIATVIGVQS